MDNVFKEIFAGYEKALEYARANLPETVEGIEVGAAVKKCEVLALEVKK